MVIKAQWIKKHLIGLGLTLAAALIIIAGSALGFLDTFNLKMLDFAFHMRGPLSGWAGHRPADSLDVVLVDVDDESYRLLGSLGWPYPRGKIWNRVIYNLTNAGAKVIVFDIEFDSRDSYTSKVLSVFDGKLPPGYEDGDSVLAKAIRYAQDRGVAVIMASTIKEEPTSIPPQTLVQANPIIRSANPDHGLIDMKDDADGFTRRYPLFNFLSYKPDVWLLSLGLKAVKHYLNISDTTKLIYHPERMEFTYGPLTIPSYGRYEQYFLTNVYGPPSHAQIARGSPWGTFLRYPLSNVVDTEDFDLDDPDEDTDWMSNFDPQSSFNIMMRSLDPNYEVPESPFKGKICIVGVSVEVLHDYKKTVFYNYLGHPVLTPGFEYHANAIQTILDQNFIRVLGHTLKFKSESAWQHSALILLAAIAAYLALATLGPIWGGILLVVEMVLYFDVGIGLFTTDMLWLPKWIMGKLSTIQQPANGASVVIPIIPPLAAMMLTYVNNVLYSFIQEQKDKRFLKQTFGTYISPELIEQMYETKQQPELGGEEGYRTAYFTDIQSFSTFSELLSPTDLVEILNEYLTAMTDILLKNRGTLDKYEGDAIVAFYGAPVEVPRHEYYACLTAVEMQEKLGELREYWRRQGDRWPSIVHDMRMRIGINSGLMVTGNMGSTMRMNYTMMGDTVNLAARLEASAKQYGIYTQVSETTYKAAKDDFEWRELDFVRVVGKTEPVKVYELICRKGELSPELEKLLSLFHTGLDYYRSCKWEEAKKAFIEAEKYEEMFPGRKTNPSRVYQERCDYWAANPPPPDWDGSWTLTKK